VSILI